MNTIVRATNLHKFYGDFEALAGVDFTVEQGAIVGLIGPNGAGKTTLLKCLLGLCSYQGQLEVTGRDPGRDRREIMEDVCFIADVGILPRWLRVDRALDYVEGVHPRFSRARALEFLATTSIRRDQKIASLSKGMVTQLHLALVMAIDASLLVLDEPTLGLDILYRKEFYDRLLNDYFDDQRSIIVSTHQVEEIEALLTDLLFIDDGRITLGIPMDDIPERYVEVVVGAESLDAARALSPIYERPILGRTGLLFEDVARERLQPLGELRVPSVSDLFVAKMKGGHK